MKKKKLFPCPFCGSEATLIPVAKMYPYAIIACYYCDASSGLKDTDEEAIEAWNRRAGGEK